MSSSAQNLFGVTKDTNNNNNNIFILTLLNDSNMARWNYDFFETSGARIILYFEGHEFNRGRKLLLNLFSENARIIRNSGVRELIETTCANYLNFTRRCAN